MEKTDHLHFDMYGYDVHIVLTDDINESRADRAATLGHWERDAKTIGLHSYNRDYSVSFIFFGPDSTAGTIAHECSHCVWQIFKTIGAEFEDELFAYHLSFLVEKCVALITSPDKAKKKRRA